LNPPKKVQNVNIVRSRSFKEVIEWEEVAQIVYTHLSKCKNNKIKGEKKK
jgi:hypothetical protein